ncbi:hypothetical protein BBJ29_007803 [Phytophthora kernoviae]|uniref:PH domain-containing protein n=1 Tax=Phytophthora kernoviae TaxID=325452 RepID=A0A3F2RUZ7_9STRA|nr:hypothetical protein BBJ29_007803 [Phytophthora kernoviae]RLN64767.1 hypothetical protein BBP00_00003266 [Phytophthora kernoviae]
MADRMDAKLMTSSPSNKPTSSGTADFRLEEIRGYLFKKTREGKWQKRWFETNGCFLTYYKKQGQKLLAALNLPQVGAITLLQENHVDGPGLFTIELNERVYTIKARSHDEAAFWVDALLWRQAGGVVTQKSPDVFKQKVGAISAVPADRLDHVKSSATSNPTTSSTNVEKTNKQHVGLSATTANPDDVKNGAPSYADEPNFVKRVIKADKSTEEAKVYNERLDSMLSVKRGAHSMAPVLGTWLNQNGERVRGLQREIWKGIKPTKKDIEDLALVEA